MEVIEPIKELEIKQGEIQKARIPIANLPDGTAFNSR